MKHILVWVLVTLVAVFAGLRYLQSDMSVTSEKVKVSIDSRIGIPLVNNGVIYFGTQAGNFYAMEMSTGRELWRLESPRPLLLKPALHDGMLYFGGEEGKLYAVDASTGREQWTFQAGRVEWTTRDIFINGTPTIWGNTIYFSSEDFNVYALDLNTGQERWRFKLDEEPQALELPIVDGIAYIGAWDGYLYAIDVETGTLKWKSETDSDHIGRTEFGEEHHLIWIPHTPGGETLSNQAPYVTSVPIIYGDDVYFNDWTGNLMAVDRETGIQKWRFKPETRNMRHVGSRLYMTLYHDTLFYSTLEDQHLYGVDRHTGQQVWVKETDGWAHGPIPGEENIAFIGELLLNENGEPQQFLAHALDLITKEYIWTSDNVSSLPTVHNGVVYFGGLDGTLHGVKLQSGNEVWKLGK